MSHFSSTDHKAVITFQNIENCPHGPGTWYFNCHRKMQLIYRRKYQSHFKAHLVLKYILIVEKKNQSQLKV